jgi:hypothetical protein
MSKNRPRWEPSAQQPPSGPGGPSWQPPTRPGGPSGLPPLLPQPPRKSWPARHKVWTAIIGAVGVFVVFGVIGSVAGSPKPTPTTGVGTVSSSPAPSPTPTTSPPPPLTSTASVTREHPKTGTTVGVHVSTLPGARITVVAHFETGDREKTARADATGLHTFWFPVGSNAPPGIRVIVTVRVSAHGQKHFTRVSFTPRQPPPPPAPKTTTAPPAPSGCYPTTSSGNCYRAGEFCPQADAGMSGIAENGEAIICEDNNGLRWEPA